NMYLLIVFLLIAALLISACGSNSGANSASNSSAPASNNTEKNTGAEQASGELVRLEMTAWGDPQVAGVYEDVIANFNATYEGKIEANIQIIPTSDYDTKLTTIIAGNETPDLAQMESATLAFPLAEEGKFLDLRPFIENDPDLNIEDLAPLHGYYSDNGELFGLNSERETFMLFY